MTDYKAILIIEGMETESLTEYVEAASHLVKTGLGEGVQP